VATGKDFTSDNAAGAAPAVLEALAEANTGTALAYGDDPYTSKLAGRLAEIFEHELAVFPMFTGTAANALALSCLTPPFGAIFCHKQAHILTSECGAPEFYTGGAKLVGLDGAMARIDGSALEAAIAELGEGVAHHFQPAALSLTQATECGTLYSEGELAALARIAHERTLKVHMDGARFANALVAGGATPAGLSWKAGIDVLTLGLTKNGAIAAEAAIFFDKRLAQEARFRQKRAGQVASKMRFVSAQLLAMFEDGLWLRLASHANAKAARLAHAVTRIGVTLAFPADINEVFITLERASADRLRLDGFAFHPWDSEPISGPCVYRFVTSFATDDADVDALAEALRRVA
jgi:threonine aldolase